MKSGRLQKYLEFLKSIPCISTNETEQSSLFEAFCVDIAGVQLFEQFGFTIQQGKMAIGPFTELLDPNTSADRIVNICEGAESDTPKKSFLDLVRLFVAMGKVDQLQKAQDAYFKVELTHSLEYVRSALSGFGKGTINDLLTGLWETPAPALFFNLWQNSPGGAFGLFKTVWKTAVNKGIAKVSKAGYEPLDANAVFELAWKQVNLSSFGNWGWKSKQYLAGKGQPRVTRIKTAMAEFYGVDLPYYK